MGEKVRESTAFDGEINKKEAVLFAK